MTPTGDATGPTAPPARLAGDWQVDELPDDFPADDSAAEASGGRQPPDSPSPGEPPGSNRSVHPGPKNQGTNAPRSPAAPPPSPVQLLEAMLFVGGPPLTADQFRTVARVPDEVFRQCVAALTDRYKAENRPYTVKAAGGGFVLAVAPAFLPLRERLYGGPREARLSQPVLDVLAVVAYRQPVPKADIDALLGRDAGPQLRLLVRLGLAAVARRADGESAVGYGTTGKFLALFGLASLDDLPRLGEAEAG